MTNETKTKTKLAVESTPRIIEIVNLLNKLTREEGILIRIEKDWRETNEWDDPILEVVDLKGDADPFWIDWAAPDEKGGASVGHFLPTPEERAELEAIVAEQKERWAKEDESLSS